jgi:hypothetical protein
MLFILILTRKLRVDPEEFLAFVHHTDETAEARVFGFEQCVEFAQGGMIFLKNYFSCSIHLFPFHVHFSEVFHQQTVDEDISATDAAQEDQVNAVVEEGDECRIRPLAKVRNMP